MTPVLIEKAEIRRLIPHAGSMCLLDGVLTWDVGQIVCVSNSHRDPANPLRRQGRLAALHAFEYGAQAAAIHGALLARSQGRPFQPGYLAALRDGRLFIDYLETVAAPLEVTAEGLLNAAGNAIYQCRIGAAGQCLAEVRVTIVVQPGLT